MPRHNHARKAADAARRKARADAASHVKQAPRSLHLQTTGSAGGASAAPTPQRVENSQRSSPQRPSPAGVPSPTHMAATSAAPWRLAAGRGTSTSDPTHTRAARSTGPDTRRYTSEEIKEMILRDSWRAGASKYGEERLLSLSRLNRAPVVVATSEWDAVDTSAKDATFLPGPHKPALLGALLALCQCGRIADGGQHTAPCASESRERVAVSATSLVPATDAATKKLRQNSTALHQSMSRLFEKARQAHEIGAAVEAGLASEAGRAAKQQRDESNEAEARHTFWFHNPDLASRLRAAGTKPAAVDLHCLLKADLHTVLKELLVTQDWCSMPQAAPSHSAPTLGLWLIPGRGSHSGRGGVRRCKLRTEVCKFIERHSKTITVVERSPGALRVEIANPVWNGVAGSGSDSESSAGCGAGAGRGTRSRSPRGHPSSCAAGTAAVSPPRHPPACGTASSGGVGGAQAGDADTFLAAALPGGARVPRLPRRARMPSRRPAGLRTESRRTPTGATEARRSDRGVDGKCKERGSLPRAYQLAVDAVIERLRVLEIYASAEEARLMVVEEYCRLKRYDDLEAARILDRMRSQDQVDAGSDSDAEVTEATSEHGKIKRRSNKKASKKKKKKKRGRR